jgi:hypothetical protein
MFEQAIYPWVTTIIYHGISLLKRYLDSGVCKIFCCKGNGKTKCVTQKQYIDLYSGPEYQMHFRYSSIMMQIYISFLYGMQMPILFVICLFGLFNMYCNERLLLAYYYKQPPAYDLELHKQVISYLRYAPIVMLINGYWAFGN